jgi:putative phosphoribosyl transferase
MGMQFRDRTEAGDKLAGRLARYANRPEVLVLALPRGGVPVGFRVARALHATLDVFLVRKLGVPGWEELAVGAIASGGIRILNPDVIRDLGIDDAQIEMVAAREQQELVRRERLFRGNRPPAPVQGRIVIVIDDGIATGATVRAAIQALRRQQPARIVVAVPVAPRVTCDELRSEVDELVCLQTPEFLFGISAWYEDFAQTSDDEVRELLERALKECPAGDLTTHQAL